MWPDHTLSSVDIEILMVSEHYHIDPNVVEGWSMPDFAKRQEYMFLRREIRRQQNSR